MTKSERTRQYIIERSASIINKKGVAGTAISDLMKVTKLAKGGIYGNFENKDEICGEVFNYLAAQVSHGLDVTLAAKSTAREKLFALMNYYEGLAFNDQGGCPLLNFGIEADDTNPKLRSQVLKAIKKSQQRMANLITEGQVKGEFNKSIDASLFAIKMFTMIEGGIFTSRVAGNKNLMKTVINMLKIEVEAF
jgi:AcrR family transcriptional regulator